MAAKDRQAELERFFRNHCGTDVEGTTVCWDEVGHQKYPRKTIQKDIRALVAGKRIRVVGMVVVGTRSKQLYGWEPVAQQRLNHEHGLTKALLKIGRLDATRFKYVNPKWRHDAELDDWAIEYDRGTESLGKLTGRIETMKTSPYKLLWVLPSAIRMHKVGAMCESLGERVWYTNLRHIADRWVDWQGQPIASLLKEN